MVYYMSKTDARYHPYRVVFLGNNSPQTHVSGGVTKNPSPAPITSPKPATSRFSKIQDWLGQARQIPKQVKTRWDHAASQVRQMLRKNTERLEHSPESARTKRQKPHDLVYLEKQLLISAEKTNRSIRLIYKNQPAMRPYIFFRLSPFSAVSIEDAFIITRYRSPKDIAEEMTNPLYVEFLSPKLRNLVSASADVNQVIFPTNKHFIHVAKDLAIKQLQAKTPHNSLFLDKLDETQTKQVLIDAHTILDRYRVAIEQFASIMASPKYTPSPPP